MIVAPIVFVPFGIFEDAIIEKVKVTDFLAGIFPTYTKSFPSTGIKPSTPSPVSFTYVSLASIPPILLTLNLKVKFEPALILSGSVTILLTVIIGTTFSLVTLK